MGFCTSVAVAVAYRIFRRISPIAWLSCSMDQVLSKNANFVPPLVNPNQRNAWIIMKWSQWPSNGTFEVPSKENVAHAKESRSSLPRSCIREPLKLWNTLLQCTLSFTVQYVCSILLLCSKEATPPYCSAYSSLYTGAVLFCTKLEYILADW